MQSKRIPFWLGSGDDALYCCLHLPVKKTNKTTGIILCNASGHEYTHSHLAIRHLAEALSNDGYATLRFDYNGTGDSPGTAFSQNRISSWLDNIDSAITFLKQHNQVEKIGLCGLRMGASLAALYTERCPIDYLMLWNPCINGKAYIRDMQILSQYDKITKNNEDRLIDSGGFIITPETAKDYNKINLLKTNFRINEKTLLINRNDIPANNRLEKHIESLNIAIDEVESPGYAKMMQQPQFSVSPETTIKQIQRWLKINTSKDTVAPNSHIYNSKLETTDYHEDICLFGEQKKLTGIFCKPKAGANQDLPVIVISNTGAAHHVGPNRLHVELCRALSISGFTSFRFDLANLGDSVSGKPLNENHPYPTHANDDMQSAITHLSNQYSCKCFIPAGLCSGANASFHCALINERINIPEAILINPLIFFWQTGLSLATPAAVTQEADKKYYAQSVRDPKKWIKLIKGQINFPYITKFIYHQIVNKIKKPILNLSEILKLTPPSKLSRKLLEYTKKGKHISFFLSSSDPGYNLLMSDAGRIAKRKIKKSEMDIYFIEGADHTFIAKPDRDKLVQLFIDHLTKRYQTKKYKL